MNLRAFLVDDEPPARERLRQLLSSEPGLTVVGEGDGSPATIDALRSLKPDVLFLDLHIPTQDGFALLREANLTPQPAVIVITAYTDRALEAFDLQVTDYLVKPCRPARLHTAIERARSYIASRSGAPTLASPVKEPSYLVRLVVRNEQQVDIVKVSSIDWLAAAGNYVVLHVGRDTFVLRESLTALENKLDPSVFVRISRSAMVHLDRIKSFSTTPEGGALILLHDGTHLPLTRGVRELQARLEGVC